VSAQGGDLPEDRAAAAVAGHLEQFYIKLLAGKSAAFLPYVDWEALVKTVPTPTTKATLAFNARLWSHTQNEER